MPLEISMGFLKGTPQTKPKAIPQRIQQGDPPKKTPWGSTMGDPPGGSPCWFPSAAAAAVGFMFIGSVPLERIVTLKIYKKYLEN